MAYFNRAKTTRKMHQMSPNCTIFQKFSGGGMPPDPPRRSFAPSPLAFAPSVLKNGRTNMKSVATGLYTHLHVTVNHSIEFKNKETGACTNLIESTWNAVKKSFPKTGNQKQLYDSYLVEYCIRKKYLNDAEDKFTTFLNLIKRVYPCKRRTLQPIDTNANSLDTSLDLFD